MSPEKKETLQPPGKVTEPKPLHKCSQGEFDDRVENAAAEQIANEAFQQAVTDRVAGLKAEAALTASEE